MCGGMIGVDQIACLPTTAAGFDMIQNHVDLLSGKGHAVPTRSTATATDAAAIIHDMCLRFGDGFPNVLVVDHDSKFTSEVFCAFVKRMGSCLVVGSAYHKNTNAKLERANCVISDTLRAYANGQKDDWNSHLPLAVFAINEAASALGGDLTPFKASSSTAARIPGSRCQCRRRATPARRTSPRRTTRSGCGPWRLLCGSCSRRRRRSGRRSSTQAASTQYSKWASACY